MALVKTVLTEELKSIFSLNLENKDDIAQRVSSAYQNYCNAAQGPGGDPPLLTSQEHSTMKQLLSSQMKVVDSPGPGPMSQAIVSGAVAFWLTPPVQFPAFGGAVTVVQGTAKALSDLQDVDADSPDEAANQLANILDALTKTVFVVYTLPPPPTGPTPSGFVF